MPESPIDATVGGEESNSYVTLEEAEAYFAQRLHAAAWDDASEADHEKALLTACRHIEACQIRVHRRPYGSTSLFGGDPLEPAYPTQALKFPRKRDQDATGAYIIPRPVKDAECEEALVLLAHGAEQAQRRALQAAGVTSFSVEGLSESYGSPGLREPLESVEARGLLAPYIERGGVLATSDSPDGEFTPGSGR